MHTIHFSFPSQSTITSELSAFCMEPEHIPIKACIILIHGLGEHSSRYQELAKFFCHHGFVFYSYDQIGHGLTAKQHKQFGHAAMDDLLADIYSFEQLVARQRPGLPIFLFGHSMGGAEVLAYSYRYNSSASNLIISAPALQTAFKPPAIKILLGKLIYNIMPQLKLSNKLDILSISRNASIREAYQADPLVSDLISSQLAIDILTTGQYLLDHASKELSCNTLIMHGDADQITSFYCSQHFANSNPQSQFKAWQGLVHEIFNEPEKLHVFEYVLEWIHKQNPSLNLFSSCA